MESNKVLSLGWNSEEASQVQGSLGLVVRKAHVHLYVRVYAWEKTAVEILEEEIDVLEIGDADVL